MKLNEHQMETLRGFLQENFRSVCYICNSGNWQFDDVLFELREFMGGGLSTEGLIKPAVAVTCATCGNIVLVNAIAAGVLQVGGATQESEE